MKYAFVFVLGLIVAIFIYPFFHELGHYLALLMFDNEIVSIEMLPMPNILCRIEDVNNGMEFLIIGFAGELLPFIISLVIRCKGFWDWYFRLSLRLICLISFVISLLSIMLYKTTAVFQQNDIINIIKFFPQYTSACMVILISLATITTLLIIKDIKELNTKKIYAKF